MTAHPTRAPQLRKSSYSKGQNDCVEWTFATTGVHVRDSKNPAGPEVSFTFAEWDAIATTAANGTTHPAIHPQHTGTNLTGAGSELAFTHSEWAAFAAGARAGECVLVPSSA